MIRFSKVLSALMPPSADHAVMVSQLKAFQKQIPLLFLLLNTNTIVLAYTHRTIAPPSLTVYPPVIFLLLAMWRVWTWVKRRGQSMTPDIAIRTLRTTHIFVVLLAIPITVWAIMLYPYGDGFAKTQVAFFMAITVIGCIFCLMHVRSAALLLTAIVAVPFIIRFSTTGEPVLTAIALNFLLVTIIMVFILFVYYRDFTALVHSRQHLAELNELNFQIANHDSLTDLPNRRSFFRDLGAMMRGDDGTTPRFALGLIDLDGFKPVNDVFGHTAGDRVLIEVGRRLRTQLGPRAHLARLGGDEFAFMIPVDPVSPDVLRDANAICEAIQVPIQLANGTARVAASIGFAFSEAGDMTAETLLERADYALYVAKAHHRGTVVVFSAQHDHAIRVQSLLEQELRRADFEAEMALHFQPIVEVATNRVAAFEALARWTSPNLGAVSPLDFIAAAERTGLINRLTEVLFAKALSAVQGWPESVGLSFNLSARDVASASLVGRIGEMLEASGIHPRRVTFEITETALIQDFDQARVELLRLKAMGARIALDDFGTGFSSLNYLHRIPIHKLKIDRSFITGVTFEQASRDIVKSVVDLCRNLKIICIVEGIETSEQALVLRSLGCMKMQGYFFGRPIPDAAIVHPPRQITADANRTPPSDPPREHRAHGPASVP